MDSRSFWIKSSVLCYNGGVIEKVGEQPNREDYILSIALVEYTKKEL